LGSSCHLFSGEKNTDDFYQIFSEYLKRTMSSVPVEQLFPVLLNLSPEDLFNACLTNPLWSQVCESEYFWSMKLQNDFGLVPNPSGLSSKQLYQHLLTQQRNKQQFISKKIQQANSRGPGAYWQIAAPNRSPLQLANSFQYVNTNFANRIGFDRFVYLPDYRVAGTINHIFNVLKDAGIKFVHVGDLYSMSNGQLGQPPQDAPLSLQTIAANSIDPLNPVHRQALGLM
jgi:hypothetical protein